MKKIAILIITSLCLRASLHAKDKKDQTQKKHEANHYIRIYNF